MNIKKPVPEMARAMGRPCPVCGKSTYSANGIHPQCAAFAADAKIRARLKRHKRASTT